MPDPVDVYSDQFQVNTGPYGCTLNFMVTSPTPPAPGTAPQIERLVSVRMSLEHLKVMAFIMRQQVLQYEERTGINVPIPAEVLNSLRIGREDWDTFWHR